MKDFIQNRLRTLLEAKSDTDVIGKKITTEPDIDINPVKKDRNISGLKIPTLLLFSHKDNGLNADEIEEMIKLAKDFAEFFKNSKQIDPEVPNDMVLSHDYGTPNSGYEYKLHRRKDGNYSFLGKPSTKHFEPGEYNLYGGTAGKILYMYTRACSEYPTSETKCKIIYNPMVDAKIKLLSDPMIADAILTFIDREEGYLDDKGEEIRAAKMSPDAITKLGSKEDLYAKRKQREKGFFGDESQLRQRQSDLVEKKYKGGGLTSDEEKELKNIKNSLKDIERERNKRISSNR